MRWGGVRKLSFSKPRAKRIVKIYGYHTKFYGYMVYRRIKSLRHTS